MTPAPLRSASRRRRFALVTLLAPLLAPLALLAACGSGGGGGGGNGAAPSGLSFGVPDAIYLAGVAATANTPTVTGTVDSWSIAPALPAGLALDPATGRISGTPAAAAATTSHTVSASNANGSTQATIRVAVENPPRYTYVVGFQDDAIGIYATDATSGALQPVTYQGAPLGQDGPEQVVIAKAGGFLWVPNLGDGVSPSNISVYAVDGSSGALSAGAPSSTGIGPHHMVLHPSGDFAYATSAGSDQVQAFTIGAGSGALIETDVETTLDEPTQLVMDPLGRFVWALNQGDSSISIFDVDPGDGTLSETVAPFDLAGSLASMAVDPDGTQLFVTLENTDSLVRLSIDASSGELALPMGATRATGDMPGAVAVHPNGDFVYVADRGDNELSIFRVGAGGELTAVAGVFGTGEMPSSIAFDASGNYAYVTNSGSHDVSTFRVDQGSGVLSEVSTPRTRRMPVSVAQTQGTTRVSPGPRFLYALGAGDDTLNAFTVDPSSGDLSPAGAAVLTGNDPSGMAVDPLGRFLVVVNETDASVQGYAIDAAGVPIAGGMAVTGIGDPHAAAVDPSGRFAFVTDPTSSSIIALRINQADGSLSIAGVRPVCGSAPGAIAVDPTGRFIVVANGTAGGPACDGNGGSGGEVEVLEFDQDQLGTLMTLDIFNSSTTEGVGTAGSIRFTSGGQRMYLPLPNANVVVPVAIDAATGVTTLITPPNNEPGGPVACVVRPDGAFAYAAIREPAGTGRIAIYSINPSGTLADLPPVVAGMNPVDLAMGPSGRFAFVASAIGGSISVLSLDAATGAASVASTTLAGLDTIRVLVTAEFQ